MNLATEALKYAHKIKKAFNSWEEAVQASWNKVRLVAKLKGKMCYFDYEKRSTGEIRTALGTLNQDNYTYNFEGGKAWIEKWYLLRYWDIEKQAWRSCDFRNIKNIHW